jgi:hypothetical protein
MPAFCHQSFPLIKTRSSNERRRARTALMCGALLFTLSQIGLAIAIEFWLPQFRDPEFGRRVNLLLPRLASNSPKPLTVVMLGSSRTMQGFNSTLLEKKLTSALGRPVVAFNFGITGAGPFRELLTLKRLLARGIHPDLLLIEILPPLLGDDLGGKEPARVVPHQLWLRELRTLAQYRVPPDELHRAWWRAWPVPCYTHRLTFLSQLYPESIPYASRIDWILKFDQSGWIEPRRKTPSSESRSSETERARQEYEAALRTFQLGDTPCRELKDLLRLCRRKKIRAALVVMPEGPTFRSWYSSQGWTQIEDYLKELERKYGFPVVNAREWILEEDFVDSHHPLPAGANLFSSRLAARILPLIE